MSSTERAKSQIVGMEKVHIKRKKSRVPGSVFRGVLKIFTGLIVIGWIGAVGYFLIYPLLPDFQMLKYKLLQNSPYNIGYNSTVSLFVKLSPPNYEVDGIEDDDSASIVQTIESVDTNAEIAGLEADNASLEVASVGIKGKIVDGLQQDAMLRGFWHYPGSSVPNTRGNVVIIGHRFHVLPPASDTFYNLDKVGVGDKIILTRDGRDYKYTVVETKVVEKNDQSVVEQTGDYRLTLVTCTPLWTSEKRLVVVAIQDRVKSVV